MSEPDKTFLVVDDEPLFVRSVIDAVGTARPNLRAIGASNGAEALELIAQEDISILLTDLRMPNLNGFELLAQLLSSDFSAPILVATAFGAEKLGQRLSALPRVRYLEKPVDLDALLELLDLMLSEEQREIDRGLAAFLQLLASEKESIAIRLQWEDKTGVLAFRTGRLVNAKAPGLAGDEAVLELLRWPQPRLKLKRGVATRGRNVESPLDSLLERSLPKPAILDLLDDPRTALAVETGMRIEGASGIALVDCTSGRTLVAKGSADQVELAACGNVEVVQANSCITHALGTEGEMEDILVTLEDEYHLLRPLTTSPDLFLYLNIERSEGSLGMARYRLGQIDDQIAALAADPVPVGKPATGA